jgi:hypothetical protein
MLYRHLSYGTAQSGIRAGISGKKVSGEGFRFDLVSINLRYQPGTTRRFAKKLSTGNYSLFEKIARSGAIFVTRCPNHLIYRKTHII